MDSSSDKTPGLGLPLPATGQPMAMNPGTSFAPSDAGQVQGVLSPVSTGDPVLGDNTDALDQEWVSKAKAIVEKTKHDPFAESKELGRIKADYLKRRYNKDIKVAEDHTR